METEKPDRPEAQCPRRRLVERLCSVFGWTYFAFICALFGSLLRRGSVVGGNRPHVRAALDLGGAAGITDPDGGVSASPHMDSDHAVSGIDAFRRDAFLRSAARWRRQCGHADRTLRVMTCNADYRALNTAAFAKLVHDVQPEIVVMQGWSSAHEAAFADASWHTRRDGELFVASRLPLLSAEASADSAFAGKNGSLAHYRVRSSFGLDVDVFNFHAATARQGLSQVITGWWNGAGAIDANANERRA